MMMINGETIHRAPLTGRRVRLRELRESDLPHLVSWWQEADLAVQQLTSPIHPQPAEQLAEMFRTWSRNTGADLGLCVVGRESDELLGHVTLYGATPKDRCATLAVIIGPPHQDKGLGTDAVRTTLRYGFEELGLHRIELTVNGYNDRAQVAYAKAGFTEEGRRREAVFRSGRFHDQVLMSILAHEWQTDQIQ
ncbi:GNAT family protein [Kitasatospora sp. NPDC002227]|uniref:GNAT family N-acetyltransferase n=1 Tax=Kitasatospora sp. NPDC002227 TaxID=3154773 RepID=UPI003323C615